MNEGFSVVGMQMCHEIIGSVVDAENEMHL
jgi:hypothetical protein